MVNIMQSTQTIYRERQDSQSFLNILYLLLAFPLGTFYFCLLVPGILLGIGTLIIWIGIPILFVVMSTWWTFATLERYLVMRWLHIEIAPMASAAVPTAGWWQTMVARLNNRMTWKTLAYLLLKLPLSLPGFVMTVSLLPCSVVIAIVGFVLGMLTAPFFALFVAIQDTFNPKRRLQQYLLLALKGFGLTRLTLRFLNSLAFLQGQVARGLLGMSDTALRLEMAKAQAEQERLRAEQADQRRRELVVNVSHELRAPVASIAGHLESLLLATEEGTRALPPETLYNYLSIAHQEARRLGLLVDELLSLARMEAGELHLDIRACAASEVVEEVYQMLMPLAQRERQVTLVRGSLPNLPPVLADRQRLVQVLLNLVRNAITSTQAGGIVSINLEQADASHLALVVEDSGMGIPAEELPRIFERFYRADASRSRSTGGFGLGLTIVRDLVTAMGGSISVESTVGQGSRFCVLLRICTPK